MLGGPGGPPAVAAPRPLTVQARSAPVSLEQMTALADAAAAVGPPGLRRGTHVRSWSLGIIDDGPPVTLPEERVVRSNPDDSRTEVVVVTDPGHPGRPVLTDDGETPHLVSDGQVLSRTTYPPSWSDATPEAWPPHGAAPPGTGQLLDLVRELIGHWTLGACESAALVRLLADAEGVRPAGRVTDRVRHTCTTSPAPGAC
ncbi:hypothetical protein [Streptomyces pseudovenezuelae]|uniref:Uncharacterized protein n=1 Tax=Streptomyces pseudovenezuelae TaxID=67350 RepID=A0ABZ1X878_9ACTN|nr:hypothetical protein [Streptomyces pseudovenezuelae]